MDNLLFTRLISVLLKERTLWSFPLDIWRLCCTVKKMRHSLIG